MRLRPRRAACATASGTTASATSTSASVDANPRLSRIDDSAASRGDAHRREHVRRLGRARRARRPGRGVHPGARRAARAAPRPRRRGSRRARCPATFAARSPFSNEPGTAASRPSTSRSRSARDARDVGVARSRTVTRERGRHRDRAGDVGRCPSAGPAPGRRLRSAARARRRRARRARRCPSGPPNLCAEIDTRSAVARPRRDVEPGHRLHRVGVQHARAARARARSVADRRRAAGWCRPRCSRASPTRRTVRSSSASASASRSTTPVATGADPRDPEPLALAAGRTTRGPPLCSKRGRDDAVAAAGRRGRRGRRPSPRGCRPRCRRR